MTSKARIIIALSAIGVAGCAAAPSPAKTSSAPPAGNVIAAAATQPTTRSATALDEIQPTALLTPGNGSSTGEAPLEAVHLYAKAQIAILDRDRASAIDFLQQAVALDPLSFELHLMLGRLYLTPGTEFSDRSIAMLEKAAELEPDHLELQTDLGRQYLGKGDTALALRHLRQALRTRQYAANAPGASIAEFFLATLLRNEGYDEAALEVFQRLSAHLKSTSMAMRTNMEVMPLREHADAIAGDIADLLVRTGRYDQAIAAFAEQVKENPSDFELRSRQVHLLIVSHHRDRALTAAEDAAVHFRADADSIALLNEACLAAGHNDGAAGALMRLHAARPNDHALLFALADVLRGDNRDGDAEKVLQAAAERDPGDFEILRRRVELKIDAGARKDAARLLVGATAARPDLDAESGPLWSQLARASSTGRLRYATLAAIETPGDQEASKYFWIWRLANAAHRDDVAGGALDRAVKAVPAFAPAYRDRVDQIRQRGDLDAAEKDAAIQSLAASAEMAGNAALAEEIRGLGLVQAEKFAEAASVFAHAMELGGKSPDLVLSRASALRKSGEESAADSLLWKLVSDHPTLRDGYEDLYLSAIRRDMDSQAQRVIDTWVSVDPTDVTARRIQAIQAQRSGNVKAAEAILNRLFRDHPADPEAVQALSGYYLRKGEAEKLISILDQQHVKQAGNYAVSTALAEALSADHRGDDAGRVLDAARGAAIDDPDLLYSLSAMYARIGKKDAAEDVLSQVLKLEPGHPGAANDLGYEWAESGKNLPEAEALARKAVDAEPRNTSYLDSMGWILYKRGKLAEARQFLDRAIGKRESAESARPADPVVLNHRGDALYRLGEKAAAEKDWQHAVDHIEAMKDDADDEMKALREQLMEKLKQDKAGESVNVSPISPDEKPGVRTSKSGE